MLNQVILVGRLVRTPELFVTENGRKGSIITLAVNRAFKNIDGEYDTDFLDCSLWTAIAENTAEYCRTGDVIGVRGRLQSRIIEKEDGEKYKKMEIIADKVTFLSSARNGKDTTETTISDDVVGEDSEFDKNKIEKSDKKKKD